MAAYIDEAYYTTTFGGTPIPSGEFPRLARTASDLIDAIVYKTVETVTDNVKQATAYEVEMLYLQGGIDAVTGQSAAGAGSEHLGDYSVSDGSTAAGTKSAATAMFNGIPVSSMTISFLRRDGLMKRWAYSGVENDEQDS